GCAAYLPALVDAGALLLAEASLHAGMIPEAFMPPQSAPPACARGESAPHSRLTSTGGVVPYMDKRQHLIWIDLEMTGRSPDTDRIVEMATSITYSDLQVVAEGPVLAIHQSKAVIEGMDDWNQHHHGASGLIERVKVSPHDERSAEIITLQFLHQYSEPRFSPMCGNSICQDRRFLARYMPDLEAFFHYRNLDVSSVKELARRWRPDLTDGLKKEGSHKALEDIRDSIKELQYYREHFFNTRRPH